jgi:putative PEP-CTERM system TPR-repeat lipoprotein
LRKRLCEFGNARSKVLAITLGFVVFLAACSRETPEDLVRAAERHIAEHEYRTAQIKLRNAIQLSPNSGLAYRLLGTALLRAGDPEAAEGAFRKAVALSERIDDVLPLLATTLLRQGQPGRLTGEFGTSSLQDPVANASFQTSLGQAWVTLGDPQHASSAFASALVSVSRHAPARLGQAHVAAQEGKVKAALAIVDEVLKEDPQLVEAYAFKAQLHLSQGERTEAVVALERAVAVDAAAIPSRVLLVSLHIGEREYDKAEAVLDTKAPGANDSRLIYFRGLIAMKKGDLKGAQHEVNRVLRQVPNHVPTIALAGEIELRMGNLLSAEDHFRKALSADRNAAAVRQLLAATHLRQGRPGKALDTLQPLLQHREANDATLMLLAGEAYLANGETARAAEFFESATANVATEASARLRLSQATLARGDFETGISELQLASASDPERHQADMLLVALHLRRNELRKALTAADVVIKKQPGDPVGYALAGTVHFAGKDLTRARDMFDAALKLQPDYLPAMRGLADVDLAEGRGNEAERRYERQIENSPSDEQLLLALAVLQERRENAEAALATMRKAIKANPQSVMSYTALVQYHLRRKNPKAAIAVAQELVTANPAQSRSLGVLGSVQEVSGLYDDAIKTYRELARIDPQALTPLLKLASVQTRQRDFYGATRTLRQAQQMAPSNDGIARDLSGAYVAAGKYEDALVAAKAVQLRKPKAAFGHGLEGDVNAKQQKWVEAERAYRTALKLEQSSVIAISLCRVLSASGRKNESARFAKDWIDRSPSDVIVRMYVADTALAAKDFKAAAVQYESVVRQEPSNVLALNNLAWALGQLKDPRAMSWAERAVGLAPSSPAALDTLGMLHVEQGNPQKGMEYLARVRSLAPHRKDLRVNYAIGLLRVGRTDDGVAELRELASSQEDFPGKAGIPALLAGL